jgi:hypothetical protein
MAWRGFRMLKNGTVPLSHSAVQGIYTIVRCEHLMYYLSENKTVDLAYSTVVAACEVATFCGFQNYGWHRCCSVAIYNWLFECKVIDLQIVAYLNHCLAVLILMLLICQITIIIYCHLTSEFQNLVIWHRNCTATPQY